MSTTFRSGKIDGVLWYPLKKYADQRGWLSELYREDEVPEMYHPVMGYISMTEPGIARGPHEHVAQADYFCFVGPSSFKLYLWDNRSNSATFGVMQTEVVGEDNRMAVVVPPGVVHAYKNIGGKAGLVFNFANQLYKGKSRREPVDEIRHEERPDTIYRLQ